jgi:tRNA pseudouridine32 synthase/23S rRNA pseudouridine746 synthase
MAEARAPLAAAARAVDERLAAATQRKAARSRELLARIWRCYAIPNARGEHASIEALFAPGAPPGGAADCAGPKLLAAAYRRGLRPIAMGELWWGAPPATGDRRAGQRYPACRGKCGVVLPWMLSGLDHEPEPLFGAGGVAGEEPRVVHEDAWLVVVDKPCGLLSVPGRSGLLSDSVLTRLRARGLDPHVVHRLDLDTSGLMLLAKDRATHAQLQRAFAERAIDKRYVALVAGDVTGDRGEIALPLRVDVDDRPRQIHDPVHGKAALTAWQVLGRGAGRTRVAFHPRTGRTHQLRVHAAHPLGLGAPIVGDRLYGDPDVRLMLHAEELRFAHPHTGASVVVARPAPF